MRTEANNETSRHRLSSGTMKGATKGQLSINGGGGGNNHWSNSKQEGWFKLVPVAAAAQELGPGTKA